MVQLGNKSFSFSKKRNVWILSLVLCALIFLNPSAALSASTEIELEAILGHFVLRSVYSDGLLFETYPAGVNVYEISERLIEPIPQDTPYLRVIDICSDGTFECQFSNESRGTGKWEINDDRIVFLQNNDTFKMTWLGSGQMAIGDNQNGAVYRKIPGANWDNPKNVDEEWFVDDVILWGCYEQDLSLEGKEPIEWIIIKHEGTRYLLLSKYILEYMCFDSHESSSWEESTVRKWLNQEFLTGSFSEKELSLIDSSTIHSLTGIEKTYDEAYDAYIAKYQTSETEDRVFLLSWHFSFADTDQYSMYMGYSNSIYTPSPTEYVINKMNSEEDIQWFYRDTDNGLAQTSDRIKVPANSQAGIRPLMWIDISGLH